jgi:hypothetical protein
VRADEWWQKERRTFPLFRWIIGIILLATTLASSTSVSNWWSVHAAVIIFAAVITFGPDLASLSIGGFKMDLLRETREDLREVRSAIASLQAQKQAQSQSQGNTMDDVIRLVKALGGPENVAKLASAGADQAASEKDRASDVAAVQALSPFIRTDPGSGRAQPPVDRPDDGEVTS